MKKRDFSEWLSTFRRSINGYEYYTDFKKVYENAERLKVEICILNSLVGSSDIETEFESLLNRYPECLKAVPILLAVRENEIFCQDSNGAVNYRFNKMLQTVEQYKYFMRKTGLFDMLSNHIVSSLYDYVTGVEVGIGSNGRKNRGGHQMEALVEEHLKNACVEYYKEMYLTEIENKWNIDGTILEHEGRLLFLWSDCGRIYMSEMDSPYSISGRIVDFGPAKYEFEMRCGKVIEAPAVLKRGDKIHIVYSANNSKSDEYCLGIMTFSGGDIFDIENCWKRSETPVFEKTDQIFGPGHCSFTTVTEGDEENDYIVYHANLESGSGWTGRHVWIQRFTWDEDDMPVFGRPSFGNAEADIKAV